MKLYLLILGLVLVFFGFIVIVKEKGAKTKIRITGILLSLISLFIVVSIFSYFMNSQQKPIENIGGVLGYTSSKFFLDQIGFFYSGIFFFLLFLSGIYILLLPEKKINWRWSLLFLSFFFLILFVEFFYKTSFPGKIFISLNKKTKLYLGSMFPPILYVLLFVISIFFILGERISKFKFPSFKITLPGFSGIRFPRPKRSQKTRLRREKKVKKVEKAREIPEIKELDTEELINLLREKERERKVDAGELKENARLIEEKLAEFSIQGRIVDINPGPFVTRYEYEPAPGIKISRILNLSDDLALRMKSHKIRVVAPLPEKGLIGIEIPNRKQQIVHLKNLLETDTYLKAKSKLTFPLGVDTAGRPFFANLRKMPHFLIAGATGSGKTVCLNSMLTSLLLRASPQELRLLLIDPKRVELSFYEGLPHLLRPVLNNRKESVDILKLAVRWMEARYQHFAQDGVRDIESHNRNCKNTGCSVMPYIVIVIDEFADLMLATGSQVEAPLARLAQMARAVGIHLVVATQRPSVDVITGTIKANFPVRVAFKVPSKVDSRTILDQMGADKLLGRGDMLFIPPGSSELIRLHGPLVTEEEINRINFEIMRNHFQKKAQELLGPGDYRPWINKLNDYGLIPIFTGGDRTALKERLEVSLDHLIEFFSEKEEERDALYYKLMEFPNNYYTPLDELEWELSEIEEEERSKVEVEGEGYDDFIMDAARLVCSARSASATLLQRKLKIGFARAARIIDQLEAIGIVGPPEGPKPRKVLVSEENIEDIIKGNPK